MQVNVVCPVYTVTSPCSYIEEPFVEY